MSVYQEIFTALKDVKPAPAYIEMHPRVLYQIISDHGYFSTHYGEGEPKIAGLIIKTHPKLTGWRIVARPYDSRDYEHWMRPYNVETLETVNVQSEDFDDTERDQYEKERIAYEKRREEHYR